VALLLCLVELAFQVRAHIRTGQSVFSTIRGQSTYVNNPDLGVKTLRPSSTIQGNRQVIRTNRYGLRGEDFEKNPGRGEVRVALLGASTIMGAYARTNAETSSSLLAHHPDVQASAESIRIINAGLGGATLDDQVRLLERLLLGLGVDQVLWYPGTNDIGCKRTDAGPTTEPVRVHWPTLPAWTLTNDLIVKNTAWVRRNNVNSTQSLVPDLDLAATRKAIKRGVAISKSAGISIVLMTSATSFRSTMSSEETTRRAASALFFRPCYTGPELASAVDALNAAIRAVAAEDSVPLIDVPALIPPDARLFGDATHFSPDGEARFARELARQTMERGLFVRKEAP
jgi:lysophospholipase L1-like esterase